MIRIRSLANFLISSLVLVSPLLVYRFFVPPGINVTLQRLVLVICLLVVIVVVIQGKSKMQSKTALILVIMALYVVYAMVGLARSHLRSWAFREAFISAVAFLAILVFCIFAKWLSPERFVPLLLYASLLPACVGVYEFYAGMNGQEYKIPLYSWTTTLGQSPYGLKRAEEGYVMATDFGYYRRISSTLATPPYSGEYFALMFCAGLGWVLCAKHRVRFRLLSYAYLTVLAALMFATISRSAWFLCGIGTTFIVLLYIRDRGIRAGLIPKVILLLAMLTSATYVAPGDLIGQNWAGLFDPEAESTRVHLQTRQQAFQLFLGSPLVGVGLGNFGYYYSVYPSSHSTLFNELSDGGLIGVCLLYTPLFCLVYFLWQRMCWARQGNRKLYGTTVGVFAGVSLVVFNNVFIYDSLFRDTNIVLLGMGAAMIAIPKSLFTGGAWPDVRLVSET